MRCWSLFSQILLLLSHAVCDLTCNSGGVKCVAYPTRCTADCDYLLKYKAASSDSTLIEISGKPSAHGLSSSSSNLWLAYGFSTTGGMSGMTVYACQKYNENYSVRKRNTIGYGVSSTYSDVAEDGVIGTLADGVMTCKYTISNSNLPSSDLRMGYGMGTTRSESGLNKHSQTPKKTSDSFSLVQPYTPPPAECSKPTVPNGSVAPNTETVESGAKYTVTCLSGYTLSGSRDITCTDGDLSDLPSCNPAPCEKPIIQDGTVEPVSETINSGATYEVTCKSGFTLSGSSTITCTNGQLSTLPSCNPSDEEEDDKEEDEEEKREGDEKEEEDDGNEIKDDCAATFSCRYSNALLISASAVIYAACFFAVLSFFF